MNNDDQNKKKKKKTDGGEGGAGAGAATTTEERTVFTVVLKIIDIHCEGCATKVKKSIRATEGVESVSGGSSKLTVVGDVDPEKLREMVEEKAKAKVELVSTVATKVEVKIKTDDAGVKAKKKSGEKQPPEEDKEKEKKKKPEKEKKKKPEAEEDKKKAKEAPAAATVVMKVDLHCDGCVQKIRKTVTKTKGYKEMSIDEKNNTVTVQGTMDMKALSELLQNQLHKPVEIVPPKKEKAEEKPKEDSSKKEVENNISALMEQNRMQFGYMNFNPPPPMYGHPLPPPMYGHDFVHPMPPQYHPMQPQYHAPQMFSDENPNACTVM